jgi:hypothetical protein
MNPWNANSIVLQHFYITQAFDKICHTEFSPVNAGVPQDSVHGPFLYLLFTAELPVSPETTSTTFADDTAVIATDNDPAIATSKLQTSLLAIQIWLPKWRMKAKGFKSTHHIHHAKGNVSPSSHLGLHPDRILTWYKNIFTKQKQLLIAFTKMYWLLGCKSNSTNSKLLIYETILKPIWT